MVKISVSDLISSLNNVLPSEVAIAVSDVNKFTFYKPSEKISFSIIPGESIEKELVTFEAIQTGQKIEKKVYKNSNGSYYGISTPIFEQEQLVGAITIFLKQKQRFIPFLTVKSEDIWKPVHLDDIIFLEAHNRKSHIISTKGNGVHRSNLSELEVALPTNAFFRCHRSYIINIYQIKEIHPDSHSTFTLIMQNQHRVPVSQNYARLFRKRFGF